MRLLWTMYEIMATSSYAMRGIDETDKRELRIDYLVPGSKPYRTVS